MARSTDDLHRLITQWRTAYEFDVGESLPDSVLTEHLKRKIDEARAKFLSTRLDYPLIELLALKKIVDAPQVTNEIQNVERVAAGKPKGKP